MGIKLLRKSSQLQEKVVVLTLSDVVCEGFKETQSSTAKFNINFAEG